MGVTRPRDLILTLPQSGIRRRRITLLSEAYPPEIVTISVTVDRHHPPSSKGRPWRVICSDGKADVQLVFFHPRRDWLEAQLPVGAQRVISGKVELFDGQAQMVHPDHIGAEDDPLPADFEPVYPLSGTLTQKLMQKATAAALTRVPEVGEWADGALLAREDWPAWGAADGAWRGHAK